MLPPYFCSSTYNVSNNNQYVLNNQEVLLFFFGLEYFSATDVLLEFVCGKCVFTVDLGF